MKLQPNFIVAITIYLIIASCADPCENVICENDGICDDGICICIGNYTSANCKFSPPEIEWEKNYGRDGEWSGEYVRSIKQTKDGGYFIAGRKRSTQNVSEGGNKIFGFYNIQKIDSIGNIEWEKDYPGSIYGEMGDIQQTSDEGFIVCGRFTLEVTSSDSDGNVQYDYWILKLDKSGSFVWGENYGGRYTDEATSIQQTIDGGYIVAGHSYSNDGDVSNNKGNTDYWVLKLDSLGSIEWEKSYGGKNYDFAQEILQTIDGGYIVGGSSRSKNGDVGGNNGSVDCWILKLDEVGNIEWEKNFGSSKGENFQSFKETSDFGYIIVGAYKSDYWVFKLDNTGNIEWERRYGGSKIDVATSVDLTFDGGYIIAGYSKSKNGDVGENYGEYDYWIIKLDEWGNLKWGENYGGSKDDFARSIKQTTDGGYIIAGHSNSTDGDISENIDGYDYWIVKLAPEY